MTTKIKSKRKTRRDETRRVRRALNASTEPVRNVPMQRACKGWTAARRRLFLPAAAQES